MKRKTIHEVLRFDSAARGPEPKPNKRRLTIMSALATGWLPWGVEWHPSLPLTCDYSDKDFRPIRYEFPLCCGHVLKPREAQEFVDAGLLVEGKTQHGDEGLVITDAGRVWLERHW